MSLEHGAVIKLVNKDTMAHSVTSVAVDKEGDPLFDVVVAAGATGSLIVPAALAAGEYPFYCSFHPNMQGTLVVTGERGRCTRAAGVRAGAADPRGADRQQRLDPDEAGQGPDHADRAADPMWTYGGTFPGPTIKRPTGSTTKVTFVNDLPQGSGSMTVHQHGGHQSSADDGQPTRFLIERGSRRTYTFPLTDAGEPMPAAFRFYHDHRMGLTARNNWYGLQGMFLVTDPTERKLGLPRGAFDVPLHLTDRSLDDENQLTDTFPGPHMHDWLTGAHAPPNDATVGKRILVNGQFAPYLTVQSREVPAPAAERLHVLGLQPRALERPSARPGRHRQRPAPAQGRALRHPPRPGPARGRCRRLLGVA